MDEKQRFTRLYDAIERKKPVDEIMSLAIDQHMLSARKWKNPQYMVRINFD